ncbi:MAG: condensation domain-containing protein [Myxococcota bacterium]
MHRALTTIERSFLAMAERMVMNPVVMVRCRGTLPPDALRSAIERVQARHDALRVRIVRDASPWFSPRGVGVAPLRIVNRRDEHHWQQVVREELNDPFDVERGPLVRFVLVQGADACELLCVTDHVNADGRSGLFVLRDVLRLVDDPSRRLVPLPDAGCLDERLPGGVFDLGRVPRALRGIMGDRSRWLTQARAAYRDERRRLQGVPPPPATARPRIDFVHHPLDPERTRALVQACRAHDNTVQGALTIACAHALAHVRGHLVRRRRPKIGRISPIDIRSALEPSVGEHFGIFAWAPTSVHRPHVGADFWDLASAARASLARARRPWALAGLRRVIDAVEMLDLPLDGSSRWPHAMFDASMVVSNLGRIEIPRRVSATEIRSFGFFAMIPNVDFVLGVQTLDQLELDFSYCPERIDAAAVKRIAVEVEAILDAAIGGTPRGCARQLGFR